MSLMQRLSMIFKAKASKALDEAEDPRETLDYSYERQLELLQKVRRGLVDVAAARKQVEMQVQKLQLSAARLDEQAKQAMSQGREDLAREALTRRGAADAQVRDLKVQYDQLIGQETNLITASRRLESKIDAFRTRKEMVKATYTAAEAQNSIGEALSGISEEMGDVGLAMQRAEDKTAQLQARSGALDELLASGALEDLSQPTDSIQAELDRGATNNAIDAEIEQMKRSLGQASAPPQLEAAPQTGEST